MSIFGGVVGLATAGLFGGRARNSRRRALGRLADAYKTEYGDLASQYALDFESMLGSYIDDRARNMELYRSEMQQAQSQFQRYFDEARTQYGQGMDRALEEMRTGREATIALTRQETERQQQRASAMNAFTGLGQTSFGQQRLEAIGRQGTLQEGAIREQYAGQLSSLEAARAAGMSQMSAQMAGGLSSLSAAQATGLSNIFGQYSSGIQGAQQMALAREYDMRGRGLEGFFQARTGIASMAGQTTSQWGNLFGSIGGSLLSSGLNNLYPTTGSGTAAGASPQSFYGVTPYYPSANPTWMQGYGTQQ